MFQVILDVNKKSLKAKGETIEEALNGLVRPIIIKTYGILTVKQGKREAHKRLNVVFLKRFFANKVLRRIVAKQLAVNFK